VSESIFTGEVAAGLQDVVNRYEVCQGLFGRARHLNRAPVAEDESSPNPSAKAVKEFSRGRLLITKPEPAAADAPAEAQEE
jgi:hypothetical protein